MKLNPLKSCIVKEFLWHPPILNWVKCNTDGAYVGVPSVASCGGIYRDYNGSHLGSFSMNIGVGNALLAEFTTYMIVIEIAKDKRWNHLWLETNSKLVVLEFKKPSLVPWKLRSRWENALHHTRSIHFLIAHIFKEDNYCADKLANFGLHLHDFTWWDVVHSNILMDFARNILMEFVIKGFWFNAPLILSLEIPLIF